MQVIHLSLATELQAISCKRLHCTEVQLHKTLYKCVCSEDSVCVCIHKPIDIAPQFSGPLRKIMSLFVSRTHLSVYNLLWGKHAKEITLPTQTPDKDTAGQYFFCMTILKPKIYWFALGAKCFLHITTSPNPTRNGTYICTIQADFKTRQIWGKAGTFTNIEKVVLFLNIRMRLVCLHFVCGKYRHLAVN